MDDDIKSFRIKCKGPGWHGSVKMVEPVTCRNCSNKRTCPSIQGLLAAQRNYAVKYKGTILEGSMKMIVSLQTKVANFILNQ